MNSFSMNEFARILRKSATDPERLLWGRLRRRQLAGFKFRRQRPIGPYICDFVCLEAGLIVELDGSQHAEQTAYDSRRDMILSSNGYRVMRFWNDDVMRRTESVLETIYAALQWRENVRNSLSALEDEGTSPASGGGRL